MKGCFRNVNPLLLQEIDGEHKNRWADTEDGNRTVGIYRAYWSTSLKITLQGMFGKSGAFKNGIKNYRGVVNTAEY